MEVNMSMKLQQPNDESTSFVTAKSVQIFKMNTSRIGSEIQFDMQCTCIVQSTSSTFVKKFAMYTTSSVDNKQKIVMFRDI